MASFSHNGSYLFGDGFSILSSYLTVFPASNNFDGLSHPSTNFNPWNKNVRIYKGLKVIVSPNTLLKILFYF